MSAEAVPALAERRVLLVGVGGLGCPAASVLAASGIGTLRLLDDDVVEPSNLPRQLLYGPGDVGQPKVEVAARALHASHPALKVETVRGRFDAEQPELAPFEGVDLVLDCVDGFEEKLALSDLCRRRGLPLIHAGALRTEGQLLPVLPGGPCLRCLFEEAPTGDDLPTCARAGVLNAAVAFIGSTQAALALAVLSGAAVAPEFRVVDLAAATTRAFTLAVRPDCPTCSAVRLDITRDRCPMTFVRTKVRLEELEPGEVLELELKGEEPHRNVSRSLREEGHTLLRDQPGEDGRWSLRVKKGSP